MSEQSGSAAKDPQHAAAVSASADYLKTRVRKIATLIKALDEAEQTPDQLLDIEIPVDQAGDGGDTGTQAEYFFIIARECRNMTRTIKGVLREAGWTDNSELLLAQTFNALVDAWSTYKKLLSDLSFASWGGQPSPDQVLAGLQTPRRNFIEALDAYLVQLLVVQQNVESAMNSMLASEKARILFSQQE